MDEFVKSKATFDALPARLRSDVRILGSILGDVMADARGMEFVDMIEEIRAVAKRVRSEHAGSLQSLSELLKTIEDDELVDVARAFNQFLNLANLAEQRFYTKDLEEGFVSDWDTLQEQLGDQLREILDEVRIELVLTAHPTEVLRRTLIRKYDTMAYELDQLDFSNDDSSLRRLIAEAWHTDEIRQQRPTPQDEAKWGFAVVENSLWEAVPEILRQFDHVLHEAEMPALALDTKIFKFSSWMGGDRDGNPFVTAEITREVLLLARWMSADLFLRDVDILIDSLSMVACNYKLRTRVGDVYEPYRTVLRSLRGRLHVTRDWAEGKSDKTDEVILADEDLLEPLLACYESLVECNLGMIANGQLLDTIRRANCFGVNLVSLDIRQDATRHLQVFNELTRFYGETDRLFENWTEQEKMTFLLTELNSKRPLIPRSWRPSDDVREVLATFELIAEEESRGLSNYIISMAANPSDVLQVALLMKEMVGWQKLPVVPLLETLSDLNGARNMLETLLSEAWYRECVTEQSNRLQVMIGYSDSAKDVGQFAAAWAQYRAQEELTHVTRDHGVALTLFHGRGGAIGRGGGPAHQAIMSQPSGSTAGYLRVTEQGEMIRFKLGNPAIAFETLTRYLFSTIEATLLPPERLSDEVRNAIDDLAQKSLECYRGCVDTALFVETFNGLTPEKELAELAIGSRPNRRKSASNVFSLRAIPWVFAWTQVRLMIPAWLGFSPVIEALIEDKALFAELMRWPFFKTQVELLEMMLAKAAPELAKQYAVRLVDGEQLELANQLIDELRFLQQRFTHLMEIDELLESQPELKESLQVRNTYLDPLHLLQAELLYRHRVLGEDRETIKRTLKVTMAGISSGLRNTG